MNELDTLIELKYGKVNLGLPFIMSLPREAVVRIDQILTDTNGWGDADKRIAALRQGLIEYEQSRD